jgi:hypothetical protein
MKLLEYRFSEKDITSVAAIADCIASYFLADNAFESEAIYSNGLMGGTSRAAVRRSELVKTISYSFSNSFSIKVDYARCVALKARSSCLFAVFEDDGLVRICLPWSDIEKSFPIILDTEASDISELLITTDLFDFI